MERSKALGSAFMALLALLQQELTGLINTFNIYVNAVNYAKEGHGNERLLTRQL